MKHALLFFLAVGLLCDLSAYADKAETKRQLVEEMVSLRGSITEAQQAIKNTNYAISKVKADLDNTLAWGIEQEKLKLFYIEENAKLEKEKEDLAKQASLEREKASRFEDKYRQVKHMLALAGGAGVLLLYLLLGAELIAKVAGLINPLWGPLINIAAPIAAFSLGYFGVKIYF
jgi:hypothetical protein